MRVKIRAGLVVKIDAKLADELLEAHQEAKRNFYLGGLRLSAVEGGRFCEASFRILQQAVFGSFDPIGSQLDSNNLIAKLANTPAGAHHESLRLHIPRTLRVVYDIRNKRDTAHLGDGIDPNLQDATLVVACLDWVLAEFIRLFHSVPADEAQKMIEELVTRIAPAIQDFNGFLKVLRTDLKASEHALLLLYQRGATGASFQQLSEWAHPSHRKNLRRTLDSLVEDKSQVHFAKKTYQITMSGQRYVEEERLFEVQ